MIKNRTEAGKILAGKILAGKIQTEENLIVLAIPRGGVVVGHEIAKKLDCDMDIAVSKKITPPKHPEYAIGAITHEGTTYQTQNWDIFSNEPDFELELAKKQKEVQRRLEKYRGSSDYELSDKTIILVDDGIATGSTVFAILKWLSKLHVKKIILAIPVMPSDTFEKMKNLVSKIITIEIPLDFSSVGQFYEEFEQVTDEEMMNILSN